jgi:hypothetical protein
VALNGSRFGDLALDRLLRLTSRFCRIPHVVLRKIPSIEFADVTEEALLIADPDIDVAQTSATSATLTAPASLIRLRGKMLTELSKLRHRVSSWNLPYSE